MAEIGRELQLTIQAAFREAVSRGHAYVTVEHLLFALLHDERGKDVLRHVGAEQDSVGAGGLDLGEDLLRLALAAPIVDADPGPGAGESYGGRRTDARARARDEHHGVAKVLEHRGCVAGHGSTWTRRRMTHRVRPGCQAGQCGNGCSALLPLIRRGNPS